MGQKIHSHGFRVGIYGEHKGWRSRWYATKKDFPRLLKQDHDIRTFLKRDYKFGAIPQIDIERTMSKTTIYIHSGRPGVLIGKRGAKLAELEEKLVKLVGGPVNVQIKEVKTVELSGQLLAENAAEQLERRQSFRRVMRNVLRAAQDKNALGCRVRLSGRLGGSDMSRTESSQFGSIPLATLSADIDYGFAEALTKSGIIGVKTWVYRGSLLVDDFTPQPERSGPPQPTRDPGAARTGA